MSIMLCEKINTQSVSAGSVESSAENQNPNESSQRQEGTAGSEEGQSWYIRKIKNNPERYERYRRSRRDYRERSKDKIAEYCRIKRLSRSEEEKQRIRDVQRRHYHRNKEKAKAKNRRRWESIKSDSVKLERRKEKRREAYLESKNHPEKFKEMRRRSTEYIRKRRQNNITYRLESNCRALIKSAILRGFTKKAYRTIELIGCTYLELKNHIENQWMAGMSWSNYGRVAGMWCIDHIRPCASFDLSDPSHQLECFNWKNLRPLWVVDNQKKASIWNGLQYRKVKPNKTP